MSVIKTHTHTHSFIDHAEMQQPTRAQRRDTRNTNTSQSSLTRYFTASTHVQKRDYQSSPIQETVGLLWSKRRLRKIISSDLANNKRNFIKTKDSI